MLARSKPVVASDTAVLDTAKTGRLSNLDLVPSPTLSPGISPSLWVRLSARFAAGTWFGLAVLRFGGATLLLAAVGLWLTPGGLHDSELALMKLGASIFMACLGLVFLQAGRVLCADEFHIDEARREIRHILRGPDGIARLRARYRFDDLSDVRVDDGMLLARDRAGRVVLNRPTGDLDVINAISVASRNGLIRKV